MVRSPFAFNPGAALKDAPSSTSRDTTGQPGEREFVWGLLVFMLGAALLAIANYGRNIPLAEDWLLVAPITGNEPDFLSWLWAQNNEHRVPLPRLIYLATLTIWGGDFRSGMVLNAATLALLAGAMVHVAVRIRGHVRFTDAFFPIALLHLGNWPNIVWGWQIQFVAATALTCVLLLVVVRYGVALTGGATLAAALAMALLPLCGANGMIFSFALAPWFAVAAFIQWRGAGARWKSAALVAAVVIAVALSALYFVNYQRAYWNPPSPGPAATIKTSLSFLAMSLGPGARSNYYLALAALLPILIGAGVVTVFAALRTRGNDRWRAAGLICFAGGCAVLVAAIGWGRAGLVPTVGMPDRYTLLSVPILLAAYFAFELFGGRALATLGPVALLLAMLVALPENSRQGYTWGEWYRRGMDRVSVDIDAGVPVDEIAQRHREMLLHWNEDMLRSRIRMLREAGLGPFARARDGEPGR